jgi:ABC-type arginine/histidine transport system permease subunit
MDRSLFLARITRITLSVIVALSIASAAYAQEALKGEVVTVDKASKKIHQVKRYGGVKRRNFSNAL